MVCFAVQNGGGAGRVEKYTKEADKYIESVWRDYPDSFFHYPETRYTIAKVVLAYLNNNEQEAIRVAEAALHRNLRAKPLHVFDEEFNTPDILISKLCNALIWMGKVDFAIEIYSTFSATLNLLPKRWICCVCLTLLFLSLFLNVSHIGKRGYMKKFSNFSSI